MAERYFARFWTAPVLWRFCFLPLRSQSGRGLPHPKTLARQRQQLAMTLQDLPTLNASLNGLCAILLSFALYFILRKNIVAHRRCMIAAVITSTFFLASYLTYHFAVHTITKFKEPAWFRPIYLTLLFTHTLLATIILPMVIVTLTRALKGRFDLHKKIARWTWPIWMYVSVTGVLIYWLLYVKFPQAR